MPRRITKSNLPKEPARGQSKHGSSSKESQTEMHLIFQADLLQLIEKSENQKQNVPVN